MRYFIETIQLLTCRVKINRVVVSSIVYQRVIPTKADVTSERHPLIIIVYHTSWKYSALYQIALFKLPVELIDVYGISGPT